MRNIRLTALVLSITLLAGMLPSALAVEPEEHTVSITVQEEPAAETGSAQQEAAALVQNDITIAAQAVLDNPVRGFSKSYPFESNYYYSQLTKAQKKWYNRMLPKAQKFQSMRYTVKKYGYTAMDNILNALYALWRDHPELELYFDMEEVIQKKKTVAVQSLYFMPDDPDRTAVTNKAGRSQLQHKLDVFDAACTLVIDQMPDGLSTYDKYRYLAAFLSARSKYKFIGWETSTAHGAIISGRAVCQGYAIAYRYLCSRANLFCRLVTGSSRKQAHMWNLVKLSGGTYHVDITWADNGVNLPAAGDWHQYFMLTQDEIRVDHKISDGTKANGLRLPKPCVTSDPIPVGGVYLIGNLRYEVTTTSRTGNGAVTVCAPRKRTPCTYATIPDTVLINGVPFSVTVIDDEAFRGCPNLARVTVGANVVEIGKRAFYGAESLTRLTITSEKLSILGTKAISGIAKNAVIQVPSGCLDAYTALFTSKTGFRKSMTLAEDAA